MKKQKQNNNINKFFFLSFFLFFSFNFSFLFFSKNQLTFAQSNTPNLDKTIVTDGEVRAIATSSDGKVYIGGSFDYVGPYTGSAVPIDANTFQSLSFFPKINGNVYTIVPDGFGGWYIGGNFSIIGNPEIKNLAHILPNGQVDINWRPNPNNSIHSIAVGNNKVYVGGYFTYIANQPRRNLAAFDANGNLLNWRPNPDGGILSIAVGNNKVYVGGWFGSIAGQPRKYLAAFDTNGNLLNWSPNPDGGIYSIAIGNNKVYVGGTFTSIAGQPRKNLAAFDNNGNLLNWSPNPDGNFIPTIYSIAIGNNKVYVGGRFTSIANKPRESLAAFDTNGNLLDWSPNPKLVIGSFIGSSIIYSIAVGNNKVYVGGEFTTIQGKVKKYFAVIDINTDQVIDNLNFHTNNVVKSIGIYGSKIYIGGEFNSAGGKLIKNLAAFDANTGEILNWSPNPAYYYDNQPYGGYVNSIAIGNNKVYVGGWFNFIANQPRDNLAAFDINGNLLNWSPNPSSFINSIAIDNNKVYVGGYFTSIANQPRDSLAAFDANGNLLDWSPKTSWLNPDFPGEIYAIAIGDNKVYVGGRFNSIDGQLRKNLAAFDANGNLLNWSPNPDGPDAIIRSIAIGHNKVYVGGTFTSIANQPRDNLAAFDHNGNLLNWSPNPRSDREPGPTGSFINSIAISNNKVFVGGGFSYIAGEPVNSLAAFDINGNLLNWSPNPSGFINSIAIGNNKLYVGGGFLKVNNISLSNFAQFNLIENENYNRAGVNINPTILNLSEEGGQASYKVNLTSKPSANVVILLSPDNQVIVNTTRLVFTPYNWRIRRTIRVRAVDDNIVEGDHRGIIKHLISSEDRNYNNLSVDDVIVDIADND